MDTPAGWYDDGSGRQRWWDGQQWTDQYSDTAPAAPAADTTSPYGVPATTAPYGAPAATEAPSATKPSIIGLIALGAAVVGTILACIPATMIIGWVLLPIAFILSIIAFFIKGKKWAPIAAVSLSVVGTIIAIIVAVIVAGMALAAYTEEVNSSTSSAAPQDDSATSEDDSSASTPEDETDLDGEDTSEDGAFRPTGAEVGAGLGEVLSSTGVGDEYTEEQLSCIGDALVVSDMTDDSLQILAAGEYTITNANDMTIFSETLGEASVACLM